MLLTIGSTARVSFLEPPFDARLKELPALEKRLFALAISPEGKWLVLGGSGTLHVLTLPDGVLVRTIEAHQSAIPCVRFSQDGRFCLSTGAEGILKLWDPSSWEMIAQRELPARGVLQMALDPINSRVFVSMDNLIVGYSIPDLTETWRAEVGVKGVYGLAISRDSTLLANAAADGRVRVWQV